MNKNPWHDDDASQIFRAIAVIAQSRAKAIGLAEDHPKKSRLLRKLEADLKYIEDCYRKDITAYRANRAFTAVHIPVIIGSINDSKSGERPEELFDHAISLAIKFTENECDTLRAKFSEQDSLDLATVAKQLPKPRQEYPSKNWLSQNRLTKSLTKHASTASENVANFSDQALQRISGLGDYTKTAISGAVSDALASMTDPLTSHLSAARAATGTAMKATAAEGILTAILFPPALPLAAAAGILEGLSSYDEHLSKEREKIKTGRLTIKEQRDKEYRIALSRIRGREPVITLASDHVYVTINLETRVATSTILSGRFVGQSLESLSQTEVSSLNKHSPDKETKSILDAWIKHQNKSH